MKFIYISLSIILSVLSLNQFQTKNEISQKCLKLEKMNDSILRHVVLFKFKEGTSTADIKKVEVAFADLPSKIPQIKSYEWGLNISPEGLNKGFTHCFILTFSSAKDRDIYLPHPDHKAFGDMLTPNLDDVIVIDYWTQ